MVAECGYLSLHAGFHDFLLWEIRKEEVEHIHYSWEEVSCLLSVESIECTAPSSLPIPLWSVELLGLSDPTQYGSQIVHTNHI